MSHILKMSVWKSSSDRWFCADVEDLGHDSALWWYPARLLGISLTDYVLLLKDKYHATNFHYNKNILVFSWTEENKIYATKFKNDINALARKKNFRV